MYIFFIHVYFNLIKDTKLTNAVTYIYMQSQIIFKNPFDLHPSGVEAMRKDIVFFFILGGGDP